MTSIFEKFGGIRPMAEKLGLPPSTVKSWHTKRLIPQWRHDRVMEAATQHGIDLDRSEVETVRPDSEPLRRGAPSTSSTDAQPAEAA